MLELIIFITCFLLFWGIGTLFFRNKVWGLLIPVAVAALLSIGFYVAGLAEMIK